MPSVASEASAALPPRSHHASARSHAQAEGREPATPFADLLDGTSASAEPPSPQRSGRSDRPERTDRTDAPKPADGNRTDAGAPSKDNANATASSKTNPAENTASATDSENVPPAKAAQDGEAATAEVQAPPKPDVDVTAALNALLGEPAPPAKTPEAPAVVAVALPQQLIPTEPVAVAAPKIEADALAALQAAGQGAVAAPAPKPAQAQGEPKGDTTSDAKPDAKAGPTAAGTAGVEPDAAVPQIESGKGGSAHGNGERAAAELHRGGAAELFKAAAADKAAPVGDAAVTVKTNADAVQNLGIQAQPAQAAHAAAAPASVNASTATPAPAAVPLAGLAVEIATQAGAGRHSFEIRLDPPELGRIDVKLDVDRDGNVSTRLVADRADTLDLLRRDATQLERALQQAGLKTSDQGLEFSLRQQGFAQDQAAGGQDVAQLTVPDDDPAPLEALRQGYGRLLGLGGGLDIRV